MASPHSTDIGAFFRVFDAGGGIVTASGETLATSVAVPRGDYWSGRVSIQLVATLAEGATVDLDQIVVEAAPVADAPAESFLPARTPDEAPTVTLTGGTGGTTETAVVSLRINTRRSAGWLRLRYRLTRSTDTTPVAHAALFALGGGSTTTVFDD